jgi:membrane associated rhomboid family serine protease
VFMPSSWMDATHRWLGLGEMPTGPVVEYLARDLSAFYALVGALLLVMASDLERYRPLVRYFAVAFIVLSILFTGVDLAAGMPWWWTASEGPGGVVFGALLFVLARPAHSKGGTA